MIYFNKSLKCKICDKPGRSIYSKSYDNEILKFFFINYYGKKRYQRFKHKIKNTRYELLKCNDCEFVWQKYMPNKILSLDLYNIIIDNNKSFKKSKLKFLNQKNSFYKEQKKLINNFKKEKINILDFGAGWGHWLMSGFGLPYNAYAYELSSMRVKFLLSNKINVLNSETLNSFKNFFHYIRLDQVLEHLDEPNKTLKMLKKLGRKNCIFYVSVPDGAEIIKMEKIIAIKKGPVQPLEHLNCFSKKSLTKFFNKNGFRPLKLSEIILMNLNDISLNLISLKSFLIDIKNYFFSTSIKFKIK